MSHAITVSRKRRVVSFLLAAFLIVPMLSPVNSHAASFTDTKGHWAEAYIERAVAQDLIKGYPDGRFEPDKQVSRAEFVSMLNRALGNNGFVSISYTDVAPTAWYYADVRRAVSASYVAGYNDGTFKPNNNISRQEAAVMIARVLPTYGESGRLQNFTDYRSVADWAYTALSKVNGKGYISGYTDGRIRPLDPLTRAQAAKIIGDIVEEETIITTDPLVKRDDTRLSGRIYSNNVTIHSDLANGSATIDNCVVLGSLIVQGGGTGTVTVNNSRVANARVEKDASPVRLLAKGETSIVNTTASKEGILQTSTLSGGSFGTGFENVNLAASSDFVLRGTFPKVSIVGSSADLTLESGSITSLTVGSGGRRSDITVESGASISNVSVYAESYFHGTGTISTMNVYANNVTYETRPRAINVGSGGSTPEQVDPRLAITFDPLDGETDVYLDTKIVVTFNTAMLKANGNTIANADLPNLIKLRRGSSTGTSIPFTGTINAAKTVMTLTPSANLDANIRYYVVIDKEVMRNSNGTYNEAVSSDFTTGTKTEKLTVTYNPINNATGIALNVSALTITFSDSLTRFDGTAITESYLKSSALVFRQGTTAINYTVSFNSNRTVLTIRPTANLNVNTSYYFGVKSNSLKTALGTTVPVSGSNFTTTTTAEAAPVASNVTISGNAVVGKTLTGNYAYTDVNGDQEGTSKFQWLVSNSSGGTYSPIALATSKTYTIQTGYEGKYLKFEVTPIAKTGATGTLAGMPTQSTATSQIIVIAEAAPVAKNVSITGSTKVGGTLTGSYTYTDVNEDPQGSSTFRWLANTGEGNAFVAIPGATGTSYLIPSELLDRRIKFEVTPVASSGGTGTLIGTPVESSQTAIIGVAEAAPVASDLAITGTPQVGQTLTASFTYFDANLDSPGTHLYRWFSGDSESGSFAEITGATSSSLLVSSSYLTKWIRFEVTPKAATGSLTGASVTSGSVGPVTAAPAASI